MPDTPCNSTSSAILNALSTLVFSLATVSNRSLGMTMSVSTFSFRLLHTGVGLDRTATTLEAEWPSDDTDGQCPDAASQSRR